MRNLSLTQIKQIAGRAGRFGTDYAVGQVTTLVQSDIPTLKRALASPMTEIKVYESVLRIIAMFIQRLIVDLEN